MTAQYPTARTVERAERRAATFAARARAVEGNRVEEHVEQERPFQWSPLTRTYRVEVTDRVGRTTSGSWSVPLERQEGRRASVRFWGWGYWPGVEDGHRIDEGMARIRTSL